MTGCADHWEKLSIPFLYIDFWVELVGWKWESYNNWLREWFTAKRVQPKSSKDHTLTQRTFKLQTEKCLGCICSLYSSLLYFTINLISALQFLVNLIITFQQGAFLSSGKLFLPSQPGCCQASTWFYIIFHFPKLQKLFGIKQVVERWQWSCTEGREATSFQWHHRHHHYIPHTAYHQSQKYVFSAHLSI